MIHLTVVADEVITGEYLVDVRISELEGGIGRARSIYRFSEYIEPGKWMPEGAAEGAVLAVFEAVRRAYADRPF